ncbi:unnamed protein product [Linum trigynum]|uniref:Uncharacterized protein n=1 Tax=Linum trigynum TaxID=586398 RepID=A0AAV2FW71_9ROSI
MYSMGYPEHMLHLGSFVATTFSRCHGKPNHLFCGPLITRLARHFDIDFEGLTDSSARGGSTPLSRNVLHNALLLAIDGTRSWVDGLSLSPEEDADLDEDEEDDNYSCGEEDDDDDDGGAMDADEPEPPLSPPGDLQHDGDPREAIPPLVLLVCRWLLACRWTSSRSSSSIWDSSSSSSDFRTSSSWTIRSSSTSSIRPTSPSTSLG